MSSPGTSFQVLDDRAREVVAKAGPSRKLCLIISVGVGEELARAQQIENHTFRIRELDAVYRNAKQPIIDLMSKAGIRILNDLEGTPQMIASASAKSWRRLFGQHPSVLYRPNVRISSNEPEWFV